jgi:NAD(P)-dependent dehydrogenase (short-subunit alcohol dehydrogenase family)
MKIDDSVCFVTGANRALGLAFAKELLGRGVKKLYAGVRNPDGVDLPGRGPEAKPVNRTTVLPEPTES